MQQRDIYLAPWKTSKLQLCENQIFKTVIELTGLSTPNIGDKVKSALPLWFY